MGYFGTKYISVFALEGIMHNVGGANMRGGLLNNVHKLSNGLKYLGKMNMLQYLVLGDHGENDLNLERSS